MLQVLRNRINIRNQFDEEINFLAALLQKLCNQKFLTVNGINFIRHTILHF